MIVILSLSFLTGCQSMSSEELFDAIEVTDIETKWVSKYYQAWPPRLILVPQVSFRVRNVSDKPLDYVNFNAVFRFKGETRELGTAFMAAIRKDAVPVGEKSDVITLKSHLGVEGRNLEHIRENPEWKPTEVSLFARSKGSQFVLLGLYDVSREIDFKEEEAVEPKKDDRL